MHESLRGDTVALPGVDIGVGEAHQPIGVADLGELAARLGRLRACSGISYRELHRRVVQLRRAEGVAELPSFNTVYRCLQAGRARLDVDLVVDIARVITGSAAAADIWRQAYEAVADRMADAAIVQVMTSVGDDSEQFVGRAEALARIEAAVRSSCPVVCIDGMAGVGKTWLARQAARRAAIAADAIVTVNLRGYDTERAPADTAAVLGEMLRCLGKAAHEVAHLDTAERSRMYRDLLAEHAVVVVLDNARDEAQVTALLPESARGPVLVTSRNRLGGVPGVRISLDVFTPAESAAALRRMIGPAADEAEPASLDRLAVAAAHLPLALALIGRRARLHPDWSLADQADRLDEGAQALRLDHGVELAIATSYQWLTGTQRKVLRMAGLHPGRDFDTRAVAALTGSAVAAVDAVMVELRRASLVTDAADGRHELHDLVQLFAAARAWDEDATGVRRDALCRAAGYYVSGAARAMDAWSPADHDERPDLAHADIEPPDFCTGDEGREWIDRELPNLVAVAQRCPTSTFGDPAVLLSGVLTRYLSVRGRYREAEIIHGIAAARTDGPARGQALSRRGAARWRLGQLDDAADDLTTALRIGRAAADLPLEAAALTNLGIVHGALGEFSRARAEHVAALRISTEAGDGRRVCRILNNLGYVAERLGRHDEAIRYFERAIQAAAACDDAVQAAQTHGNIAAVLEATGQFDRAAEHAAAHLDVARSAGHRPGECDALAQLARLRVRAGDTATALSMQRDALEMAREIGYREKAAEIERDLADTSALVAGRSA